jgi:hypothetical protein
MPKEAIKFAAQDTQNSLLQNSIMALGNFKYSLQKKITAELNKMLNAF